MTHPTTPQPSVEEAVGPHPAIGQHHAAVLAIPPYPLAFSVLLNAILDEHQPTTDEDGNVWCGTCYREDAPAETWLWPCRLFRLTAIMLRVPPGTQPA